MKGKYWEALESAIYGIGFSRYSGSLLTANDRYYARPCASGDVCAVLHFAYKQRARILTAHLGWVNPEVKRFCVDCLERYWPGGYEWLRSVGMIESPVLNYFNLQKFLDWRSGGMPVNSALLDCSSSLGGLVALLSKSGWLEYGADRVMQVLVSDASPYPWGVGNGALRIAEIAGFSSLLGYGVTEFDRCAVQHRMQISGNMFQTGSADDWLSGLRAELLRTPSVPPPDVQKQ